MRKAVKRLGAAILAAALIALPGCASGGESVLDPKNPVSITVWHYYNGVQLNAFNDMVAEFNQTKGRELGVFVEAISQGSVNELFEKLIDTADGVAGAGSLPDIFAAYTEVAYDIQQRGRAVDLSTYMMPADIAVYVDGFWQEGVIGGKPYVFPTAKCTEILYIDQLAWDAYAAAVGDEAALEDCFSTWENVVETARDYYAYTDSLTPDVAGDGLGLLGIDSISNYMLVSLRQLGVDFMYNEDDKGVVIFDEAALRRVWDVYYGSVVRGYFNSVGRFGSDDVKTGVVLGYVGSSSGSAYFPDIVTLDDGKTRPAKLAALPVPVFEGAEKYAVQQGGGMVVTKSDKQHEYAGVEFLKWFTEEERNLKFSMLTSYLPVKADALEGPLMEETLQTMENSGDIVQQNTAKVFRVSLRELGDHGIYFSSPFPGRLQVRYVLDDIRPAAVQARADVLAAVAGGEDYAAAVERYCGDDAFAAWLHAFRDQINAILADV